MAQKLHIVIGAIAAFLLYKAYQALRGFVVDRLAAAKAKKLGCQDAPKRRHRLPYGIDMMQRLMQADREQLVPTLFVRRFEEDGAWTIRDSLLGGSTFYVTCEPRIVQAVLATQFQDFALGDKRRAIFGPLLGKGIFTEDGRDWEHSRAMLRPQFARDQVSDLNLEEKHLQDLMRALPVERPDDDDDEDDDGDGGWTAPTDLQVLFFRLTLDSATEFLFGESVNAQLNELAEERGLASRKVASSSSSLDEAAFARAFDLAQHFLSRRGRFQHYYWLVTSKEFRAACRYVHDFVDHFVRLALTKRQRKEKEFDKGERERYVFLNALAAETQDPIQLRYQLLNILLAGRDSTASLLGWLFYLLVRHPPVFEKLRDTIIDTFGTYGEPHGITFERLKSCQYLQHCLNETLRLYPIVPVNFREAVRDTTLPCGGGPDGESPLFVRKGQAVNYNVHAMHRRKDLWGQDADDFKPDRWLHIKPTWTYLPFNGGPRICLGRMYTILPALVLGIPW